MAPKRRTTRRKKRRSSGKKSKALQKLNIGHYYLRKRYK